MQPDAASTPLEGDSAPSSSPTSLPVNISLEELITCPICFEILTAPKALPCLHTFCTACLERLLSSGTNAMRCPVCRKDIPPEKRSVRALPDNFQVKKLIEMHNQQQQQQTAQDPLALLRKELSAPPKDPQLPRLDVYELEVEDDVVPARADDQNVTERTPIFRAYRNASSSSSSLFLSEDIGDEEAVYYAPNRRKGYWPLFSLAAAIVNITFFAISIWLNGGLERFTDNPFAGPSGAKDQRVVTDHYQLWRLIVPIFLHGGAIHLGFTLFFLLQFVLLERRYGCIRVGMVYMLSGIGGFMLSSLVLPNYITVGSDGALCGLAAMVLVSTIRNICLKGDGFPFPKLCLITIFCTVVAALVAGLLPLIDTFGHFGGLAIGFIASIIFVPTRYGYNLYTICMATLALAVLGAAYGWALWAIWTSQMDIESHCGQVCGKMDCYDFGHNWWNCSLTIQ